MKYLIYSILLLTILGIIPTLLVILMIKSKLFTALMILITLGLTTKEICL